MGTRSKQDYGGGSGGGALRFVVEQAAHSAGPGGIVMTVWTPGWGLTAKDQEELHNYLVQRWGASFAGSIGSEQ